LDGTPAPYFQGPGWMAGSFYRMSFSSVSACLLEAYRNSLPDRPSFEELDALAAAVPPGGEGVRLRPGTTADGVAEGFVGLTNRHGRGHAVRCILETVAQALAGHVGRLCGSRPPDGVRCAGGGARSALWLQIKADIVGVPMTAMACSEPTSLGAALLAARALGWGDVPELIRRWVRPRQVFRPDPETRARYQALSGT
jgi:xylulokinase